MGRRSTKSSPAPGAALPFDTVGMTILPGVSLPAWAEPAAAAAEALAQSAPELIADAPEAVAAATESAFPAPPAADTSPPEWAAAAQPVEELAGSPEPALAMAGSLAGASSATGHTGYGHPAPGYLPEPSRYPVGAAAGLAAMSVAPSAAPAMSPGYDSTTAAANGPGWPASAQAAPAGYSAAGPAMATAVAPAQTAPPAATEHPGAGGLATATSADGTGTRTLGEPAGAHAAGHPAPAGAPGPEAPSSGWKSPERPELSPEHVALLSWWADMIAAGQFPAPAGMPGTEASPPVKQPRRAFPFKAAALGLVAVVAVGAAAVVGPKVMASSDPVVIPTTELSLPATVGGLVAITDPAVGTELEVLLGFGLRPAGVTVTNAYGSTPEGPLAMAAMATTMGAPAEAVGQIAAWAERTGATVAPSVAGTGANEGITCAAVEAIPEGAPGSFCVWTASGERGQTYTVGMTVEGAQTVTNQLRTSVTST